MARHRMTKACAITRQTRLEVALRDNGRCVNCGSIYGIPNAHFVPRSHGGLGIEQNILTLCPTCHHLFDNSDQRQVLKEKFREYLSGCYADWDESKLYYKKWRFV